MRSSTDSPELHSFPTRRSSDLQPHSRREENLFEVPRSHDGESQAHQTWRTTRTRNEDGAADQQRAIRSRQLRSEEHTSELQSQFHLVCRPLLEKKNQRESAKLP